MLRDHFIQWTATHSRAAPGAHWLQHSVAQENFRKVLGRLEIKVVVATKHLAAGYVLERSSNRLI